MASVKEEKVQFKHELSGGRSSVEPLTLTDLEADDTSDGSTQLISPRDLAQINFRSLIGHTDEVCL